MQVHIKKQNKIRVVHVANNFGSIGGVSEVVSKICIGINKQKYEVSLIYGRNDNKSYVRRCEEANVKCIEIPKKHEHLFKYFFTLKKELRKGNYDIVHIHGNSSLMVVEMFAAILAGAKIRVSHTHSSGSANRAAHLVLRPLFNITYHYALSTSRLSGEYLYGKRKFDVIYNPINVDEYTFSNKGRTEIRRKYNIHDNETVIGNVGRLSDEKNLQYVLQISSTLGKNVKCMFVGDGKEYEFLNKEANRLGVKAIFTGSKADLRKYYSAMDVFLMPSEHEGFGNVVVEAQANGLPCIVSKRVPEEVKVNHNVVFLDLGAEEIENWAQHTLQSKRTNAKKDDFEKFKMKNTVNKLEQLYLKWYNKKYA